MEEERVNETENFVPPMLSEREERMILEQIKYLHSELVGIQQAFLNAISIPVGIYVVAIYYAFHSNYSDIMFALLPFFFSLSVFNIVKYSIKMLGIDAYIRYLEGLINTSHQKNLFLWQSCLAGSNGFSVSGVLCLIPPFGAIAYFLGYQFKEAIKALQNTLSYDIINILIIAIIVEMFFLILAIVACLTQYHEVTGHCKHIGFNLATDKKADPKKHTRIPLYICFTEIVEEAKGLGKERSR